MRAFMSALVRFFLTGVFTLLPLFFTVFIVTWLVKVADAYIGPSSAFGIFMFRIIGPGNPYGYFAGYTIVVLSVILLGFLVTRATVARVHHAIDATLARIPLIGKIYSAVGQIVDLFGKKDPGGIDKFGGVGQIRIGESSMLGLLTSPESFSMPDGRKYFLVFVPNSPIPATGFNILVPVENFFKLDLPMEELAKLLMSLGLLGPQVLGSRNRKDE